MTLIDPASALKIAGNRAVGVARTRPYAGDDSAEPLVPLGLAGFLDGTDEDATVVPVSEEAPLPTSLSASDLDVLVEGASQGVLRPFRATANFNRPNDASVYAIGDAITASTVAANSAPMEFLAGRFNDVGQLVNRSVLITSVRLIATAGAPAILPRFNLYAVDGPFAAGSYPADNAVLRGATGALTVAGLMLEQIVGDVTAWTQAGAAVAYADIVPSTPLAITTDTAGKLRALLEARNAAAPTANLGYTAILRGLH